MTNPSASTTPPTKVRIPWIDTAKGICILLVILQHSANFVESNYPLSTGFMTFRMPLYFILSGLFFKSYSGFLDFTVRKINKLIIPYIFWFAALGVLLPIIIWQTTGHSVWYYDGYGLEVFQGIFDECNNCNPHIWFLSCLFIVNVLFYLVILVSKDRVWLILSLSLTLGCTGLLLSCLEIDLPYFLDSSLSSVPFFAFGWYLRKYTRFLHIENSHENTVKTLRWVAVFVVILCIANVGRCNIVFNTYGGWLGCLVLYPYGIAGTLGILSLSRIWGTVPVVSYLGRYSIIVLCTHGFTLQLSYAMVNPWIEERHVVHWCTFFLTALLSMPIIAFCKKYLPYFTAQKDLIKMP